jgi:hypothetical protein
MSVLDWLFPVTFKDLQRITVEYEKALGDNPAKVQVSLLWCNDRKPAVQRSSTDSKTKEGEDNRKG